MKLNENGDFCLLFVEATDEKECLFEVIGAQKKPVVLLLPQAAGQPRSRLFQRPEDFSDLKHVRRQTGVPIIFLTASSELLAQMAARHGFPSYPSVDAFARMLAQERSPGLAASGLYAQAGRRARTGPLVPSAGQIAAIRRSMPAAPLREPADDLPWPLPAGSMPSMEYSASVHMAQTLPLPPPADVAVWDESAASPALAGARATPIPPARDNSAAVVPTTPVPAEPFACDERDVPPWQVSEIPRRRSAQPLDEPHSYHPGWSPLTAQIEGSARPALQAHGSGVPVPQAPAGPAQTTPAETHDGQPRRSILPVLITLSLLILAGAGLGSFVAISRIAPVAPAIVTPVGSLTFLSSEQLNENTSQGIDDEVQISLHSLGQPAPGKSYYAWLLGDKDQLESRTMLLGKLNVVNGVASMLYPGDGLHTNLLQFTSRFLVTEEASNPQPLLPTPDSGSWRYAGNVPAAPDPKDAHHFSFLNHLRHLLADEPVLDELELPGGLNNWFTRNSEKLIEWTSSARDRWQDTHNLTFVRNEAIQILAYLDGMSFLVQELPPALAGSVPVTLDTHLAALGLLNVRGPNQNPPAYIDQIVYHLNGLINAPGSPVRIRNTSTSLLAALSSVTAWLQALRKDDRQLLALNTMQLGQPAALSLLDDMVLQASNAYTGGSDPSTGQFKQGVVWIHRQLQSMATINVVNFLPGGAVPEIGPASQQAPSLVLWLWRNLEEWL
jgi:hypothetical protein